MKELQNAINYHFKDKNILIQALTHSSFANEAHGSVKVQSNERLEFLGDAVVSIVTASYLFFKFPNMQEGQLTKLKASLICTEALSGYAEQIDLGKKIIFGKSAVKGQAWNNASMLENTFEALTGAIYLDGGFEEAETFLLSFLAPAVENHAVRFKDYKTMLQEAVQRDSKITVRYKIIGESGPDHDKRFSAQALSGNKVIGTGDGKTKKGAEQNAAKNAMMLLGYTV